MLRNADIVGFRFKQAPFQELASLCVSWRNRHDLVLCR